MPKAMRGGSIPVFKKRESPSARIARAKRIARCNARIRREREVELQFLRYVQEHPGLPSKQVYKLLGFSYACGSAIRESLQDEGDIVVVLGGSFGRGKVRGQCISITEKGRKTLEEASKTQDPVST